jgi:hypothetical protein
MVRVDDLRREMRDQAAVNRVDMPRSSLARPHRKKGRAAAGVKNDFVRKKRGIAEDRVAKCGRAGLVAKEFLVR